MEVSGHFHAPATLPSGKKPVPSSKNVHLFPYVSGSQPHVAIQMRFAGFLSEVTKDHQKIV